MNKVFIFLLITMLGLSNVHAQSATIWGVGDNYEIDYLHSGSFILSGKSEMKFVNEPSTEYTIMNVTNRGYDYNFIGYGGYQIADSVYMSSLNIGGFASIAYPNGGMPVMLPLAYGSEDNWLKDFVSKIDQISKIPSARKFLNLTGSIDQNVVKLKFDAKANSTKASADLFFNLPFLQLPKFAGKNNTYVNSTFSGDIRYKVETGILFSLNVTMNSNDLLVDGLSKGSANISQQLEFVTIIPPISIIDGLPIQLFYMIVALILFPILKRK